MFGQRSKDSMLTEINLFYPRFYANPFEIFFSVYTWDKNNISVKVS